MKKKYGNATDCFIATPPKTLEEIYKTPTGRFRTTRNPISSHIDYSQMPRIPDPLGIPKKL